MIRRLVASALLWSGSSPISAARPPLEWATTVEPTGGPQAARDQKPQAGKGPATLSAIEESFAEEQKKALRTVRQKKLAALETYVRANPAATDRAAALHAACDLALQLGLWTKGREHAEAFLRGFPGHKHAGTVRLGLARCLLHEPGREALARAAFERVIDDGHVALAVAAATELSALLAADQDVAGAKGAFERLAEKHPRARGPVLDGKIADLGQIGREPEPIDVDGLDGRRITLAGYRGKVLLIDFWATGCGPCVSEMPGLVAMHRRLHDRGFDILGITLDTDEQAVRDFVAEHGMSWAQFFDGKGNQNEVAQLYRVAWIPQTYLLDREGKVRGVDLRGEALERAVGRLLDQDAAASAPGTRPGAGGGKR